MPRPILLCCLLGVMAGCVRSTRPDLEPSVPRYEHVFLKPLEEALAETRRLLEERGYSLEPTEDPSQLLSVWQVPPSGTQGNGSYVRYLVSGIRVGPRQSVVRIFRMTRRVFGNDVEIKSYRQKFQMELKEESGSPFEKDRLTGEKKEAFQTDALAEKRGVTSGTRDLDLEQELTLRLESGAGIEIVGRGVAPEPAQRLARDSRFYLERWKQDANEPPALGSACAPQVRGFRELLRQGLTLLVGEQLGSQEAPAAVGGLVCEAAVTGYGVALGLSIPSTEQERIDQYLASPGAPADQDALLLGDFWRRPYQDGRSSLAILDLIDRVRSWRAWGLPISLVAYDTERLTGSERDAAQAEVWRKRRQARPEEVFIVLAGNTHTRTVQGTPWDRDFTPMARRLAMARFDLVALDLSYAQGRRWGCDLNRSGQLECTIVGASPAPRVAAPPGQTPYVKLFSQPTDEGYHGLLYVGALSPSLPVTSLKGHEPPPTSEPPDKPKDRNLPQGLGQEL